MNSGLLVVVSGPAGVGKGTVVSLARERNKDIVFSVSATSRCPRPGETDGVNYFFVSRERFLEMIRRMLCWNGLSIVVIIMVHPKCILNRS